MQPKRPTIHEVADRAGVSHQTVSRYLRQQRRFEARHRGEGPGRHRRAELPPEPGRPLHADPADRPDRHPAARGDPVPAPSTAGRRLRRRSRGRVHRRPGRLSKVEPWTGRNAAQELADSGEFEGILALASLGAAAGLWSGDPVVIVADYDDELRGLGALADGAACGEVVRYLSGPRTPKHAPPRRSRSRSPPPVTDARPSSTRSPSSACGHGDRLRLVGASPDTRRS